jgi:hypothetical protein
MIGMQLVPLLRLVIFGGCFACGADVAFLVLKLLLDSRNVGLGLLAMLLGGVAGVLVLDKRMSRLVYKCLERSDSWQLIFIVICFTAIFFWLWAGMNISSLKREGRSSMSTRN